MKINLIRNHILKRLHSTVFPFCNKMSSKDQNNQFNKISDTPVEKKNNQEKNLKYFKITIFEYFSNFIKKYQIKINENKDNKEQTTFFNKIISFFKSIGVLMSAAFFAILMTIFEYNSWYNRYNVRAKEIYRNSKKISVRTKSIRNKEINMLNKFLQNIDDDDEESFGFIIVKGEKGVGKTTMIKTVLDKMPGVVVTNSIESGTTKEKILQYFYSEICGNTRYFRPLDPNKENTLAIINAYNKLYKKEENILYRKPIIVIPVDERKEGAPYAQLSAAARTITEMGCKVILDVSDDAYQNDPNLRELIIDVDLMTRDQLEEIKVTKRVFDKCKDQDLKELMFALLGGNPQYYNQIIKYGYTGNDEKIKDFILIVSIKAMEKCKKVLKKLDPEIVNKLIQELKENGEIKRGKDDDIDELANLDLKGFVRKKDNCYMPSNAAVNFFIKSGLYDALLKEKFTFKDLPPINYENLRKYIKNK